MLSRKVDEPLRVQVPKPSQDRPSWRMVGVIAAMGFLVGVMWPRFAGVRIGPSLPEGLSATTSASAVLAPVDAAVAATVAAAPSVVAPGTVASGPSSPPVVSVAQGVVTSCKTADGESPKPADCPKVTSLDALARSRLRKLADCPEAADARGRVQFVLHLDFARGLLSTELGRVHGVGPATADSLLLCARSDLSGAPIASVAPVPHDYSRYTVAYSVTFTAVSGATPDPPAATVRVLGDGADEEVQIVWDVALVRDAPKTGKVLARLQRGAAVRLGPVKDGWYPARFGDGFAEGGWLYRGAVGR